ncbi:hypothetical protein BJY04DRAFT_203946 [Aspergillus karnatakaensis]|uniref:uncharacterized protein n=1 Tax=Aspergillus karnatakaensis TaxID=1810916 RepID=UPI003CCDCEB0
MCLKLDLEEARGSIPRVSIFFLPSPTTTNSTYLISFLFWTWIVIVIFLRYCSYKEVTFLVTLYTWT